MDQTTQDQFQQSIIKEYIDGVHSLISFYQTDIGAFDGNGSDQNITVTKEN